MAFSLLPVFTTDIAYLIAYIWGYTHTHIYIDMYTYTHIFVYIHAYTCVYMCIYMGFPGGSSGKESTCNVGDLGIIPWLGRSLREGKATNSNILAWRIPWTV